LKIEKKKTIVNPKAKTGQLEQDLDFNQAPALGGGS